MARTQIWALVANLLLTLVVPINVAAQSSVPVSDFGGVRIVRRIMSLQEIRQARVVRQRWDLSCGSAALSTVLTHHYGDPVPETAVIVWILRRTDPIRIRARGGFSLLDLKRFVEARGYQGRGYAELSLDDLRDFRLPVLVPIRQKGYDHFVVFRGVWGDRVLLADPAFGNITLATAYFLEIWQNGVGFVVLKPDALPSPGGLEPRPAEFLAADRAAIGRAIRGAGPVPATRRGF